jgi:heme exporter protein CcmD
VRAERAGEKAMTHLGYIIAAYVAAAIVLGGMIAWVTIDLSAQKRKLERIEAEGGRRARAAP